MNNLGALVTSMLFKVISRITNFCT